MIHKFIVTITLLFCCGALNVIAYDLKFTPEVSNSLQSLEASKEIISKKIDSNLKIKRKSSSINFKRIAEYASFAYDSLEIDSINNRVSYAKKSTTNSGIPYADELSFANEAQFFLDKLPNPLSESEASKVLYTKFEKSMHEELNKNGTIDDDTHLRIHSAVVKIGRTLHGFPIFNSYATIGIDAIDHHISYLDLSNWISINNAPPKNYLSKITRLNMEKKISEKIMQAYVQNLDMISLIEIQEVVFGWQLDALGKIMPAVIFKGKTVKNNSKEIDEFTSLEQL